MNKITIKIGDNLLLLKEYPDNYFDSVVTDAPYGLGNEPDVNKLLQDWLNYGYHEITGKGFMGKKWDAFVPKPIFWKEVFRVLKPGGHLLCFFGTRTYDWGTLAIRLAGFEIRDMITWHYGSGFPKSLDVSKAIDKACGFERDIVKRGKAVKRMIPGADQNKSGSWIKDNGKTYTPSISIPSCDDAKKFNGWGTSLKPATEPICVARKPLCGTVAENMIKYNVGGINIDKCRIDSTNELPNTLGRFPSNVILDSFSANILDDQSGELTSGKPTGVRKAKNNIYGQYGVGQEISGYADTGGASRFFYCAKASQFERNAGCENLELKDPASVTDFRPTLKNSPENWATTESAYMRTTQRKNIHPTVKPISLMRWLQRLVTPKGGLILDPFAGSGTSGCAAAFEGFDIVLMEIDEEGTYLPIIEARTKYWQDVANRERYIHELKQSQGILF